MLAAALALPPADGLRRWTYHYLFGLIAVTGMRPAPRSLLPSPALLAFIIQRPISVDEYLLWSIAEGGKQFDTEMPAFKTILTRDEIWQIIGYMRAGFPLDAVRPQDK